VPLDRYGRIYADEAGVHVIDRPSPFHQLLVLSSLLGARIPAGVAVVTTRALIAAAQRTSVVMAEADWQARVDAWQASVDGGDRRHYGRLATLPWLAWTLVRVGVDPRSDRSEEGVPRTEDAEGMP